MIPDSGICSSLANCILSSVSMDANDFLPRCLKFEIYFLNVLYFVLSGACLFLGFHIHFNLLQLLQELISVEFSPVFMFMVMGIALILAAVFGFVGTLRENAFVLRWYLVSLLFLFIVHIFVGIFAYVVYLSPPTIYPHAELAMRKAVITYKDDDYSTVYIDKIQVAMHCCGVSDKGYKDWMLNSYFSCNKKNLGAERCGVPPTCCKFDSLEQIDLTCGYGATDVNLTPKVGSVINIQGCVSKTEETVQYITIFLFMVAFGIALALIPGILLTSLALKTLDMKVLEFWNNYDAEKNIMHYTPSVMQSCVNEGGIYTIPISRPK